jgi:SPP1 gp7 family putative phage head morphogenesis protein
LEIVMSDVMREHRRLEDMVNTHLLAPLTEFNGLEECKMHFVGMTEGLTEEKVTNITKLKDSGMLNKLEPWVRELLGIPPWEDEYIIDDPVPAAPGQPPNVGAEDDIDNPNDKENKGDKTKQQATDTKGNIVRLDPPKGPDYLGRANYQKIEDDLDRQEKPAVAAVGVSINDSVTEMLKWLEKRKILQGKNRDLLEKLPVPAKGKRELAAIFHTLIGRSYFMGKLDARSEIISAAGGPVQYGIGARLGWPEIDNTEYMDKAWLRKWLRKNDAKLTPEDRQAVADMISDGFFLTGETERSLITQVQRTVLDNVGKIMPAQLAAKVRELAPEFSRARAVNIVRTNAGKYYNDGRFAEMDAAGDLVVGGQYSAIMDQRTTEFCWYHHGKFLLKSNPMYGRVPSAHFQCRSITVVVLAGEEYSDNWNEGVPAEFQMPMRGFGA